MSRRTLALLWLILAVCAMPAKAQRRISDDRDLKEIDLTGWDCLHKMEGSANNPDSAERNRGKNRSAIDLSRLTVPNLDTAGFLKLVAGFDLQTKGKRRKDLSPPQRTQLDALEKQVVSLTGYLVLAYAGPPESTNCGSVDFHDWHLEIFEQPLDHPPQIGDPTPIICETTPRTQSALYRDNIRLVNLAAFMRRPDMEHEPTGHKAQKIRLTGYLLWDDDHNGTADIGTRIASVSKNKYHHPWRSTAWEIHPVIKIEPLEGPAPSVSQAPPASLAPPVSASTTVPPSATLSAPAPAAQKIVTILEPVTIKIPYGETVLPRGMKLEFVARDAQSVTVQYMGAPVRIPLQSTDLG